MKFDTAWLFYRSNRAIAVALGVSDQAVSLWKAKGVIPIGRATDLQKHSNGGVKVDPSVYTGRTKGSHGH